MVLDHSRQLYLLLLENEAHNILGDFEMQTDNQIQPKMPELIKKKKNLSSSGLYCSKKIVKYLDLARELKRLWRIK